jgi:hypothetical protein
MYYLQRVTIKGALARMAFRENVRVWPVLMRKQVGITSEESVEGSMTVAAKFDRGWFAVEG